MDEQMLALLSSLRELLLNLPYYKDLKEAEAHFAQPEISRKLIQLQSLVAEVNELQRHNLDDSKALGRLSEFRIELEQIPVIKTYNENYLKINEILDEVKKIIMAGIYGADFSR